MATVRSATNHPSQKSAEGLQFAAQELRATLLELVQDRRFGVAQTIHTGPRNQTTEQSVAFEVGFGSPGLKDIEPSLSLESLRTLLSGEELCNVPIMLPSSPSSTPLPTAVAQSFPLLVRGTILRSQLCPSPLTLPVPNQLSLKPFEEARANITALNITSVALYKPRLSPESDYYAAVEGQFAHNIELLEQLVGVGAQPRLSRRDSNRIDPLSATVSEL